MNNQSQLDTLPGGHGLRDTDPQERRDQSPRRTRPGWPRLRHWMGVQTFAPSWLPVRLRLPVFSYLAAVIIEGIAVALTLLLEATLPAFSHRSLLVILGVVLVALTWGAGPSLVATLVGALLLNSLLIPTPFTWGFATVTDAVSVGLVLGVGLLISLVAGQVARARLQATQARQEAESQAAQLRTALAALEEAKAHQDAFLGIVSHELRTPLTTLKLSIQMTRRRLQPPGQQAGPPAEKGTLGGSVQEYLAQTEHQLERLERLVNDLLDVSRAQTGRLDLRRAHVDLATILLAAVEEQRQAAQPRTITLQLPADLPVPVQVDPGRIEQVVTNYLTNALKYSPEERPVAVGLQVEQTQARVWVRDEGPGLPADEQAQMWERFHRVPGIQVQSGSGIGLGLGLHISKMIIEQHGGQVGVESAPGAGSTFWFSLPLERAELEIV